MDKKQKSNNKPHKKKDNKCFQYAVTIALYKIGKNTEGTSKSKPFIDKHNWEGINYPSGKEDWKTFEKNNPTIAWHNIGYYKGWHYIAVQKIPT